MNLLAYGPVTTPVNGFTVSVDADGSLLVSGGEGLAKGKGVAWRLDASRFTPGRYRLTLYGDAWTVPNVYPAVWTGDISTSVNRLGYVNTGGRTVAFDLTAEHIRKGLLFGFCRRLTDDNTGFGPIRVRACLTPAGSVPGEWVAPDDITAVGGGELDDWTDNLFILPDLPAQNNGITFTRVDGHTVHVQGTGWSSATWPSVGVRVKLEAGEYSLASSTSSDRANVYPMVTNDNDQGSVYLIYRPGDQPVDIPDTGTLTAGWYRCFLRARPGVPVNADITPILLPV